MPMPTGPALPLLGARVVLTETIDAFPHFRALPGLPGTIVQAEHDLIRMHVDRYLAGAEEWNNEIHWHSASAFARTTSGLQPAAHSPGAAQTPQDARSEHFERATHGCRLIESSDDSARIEVRLEGNVLGLVSYTSPEHEGTPAAAAWLATTPDGSYVTRVTTPPGLQLTVQAHGGEERREAAIALLLGATELAS